MERALVDRFVLASSKSASQHVREGFVKNASRQRQDHMCQKSMFSTAMYA